MFYDSPNAERIFLMENTSFELMGHKREHALQFLDVNILF
jgi:hypothetical protein